MKSRSITQEQIKAIADRAEAPSRGEDHSEARQLLQSVLTEDGMNAEIRRLASLPEGLYEAERREAADKLKVRATVLDKLIKAERPKKDSLQGTAIQLVAREPAASTVDLSQLLDDIVEAIKSYIILKEEEVIAAALWIVASYAGAAFYIFSRLGVRSSTRQCGKTTLLDVIEALVNKPLVVSNTTGAALVRIISLDRPTLLVDEADTFLTSNEDLRGIVNAGHKKGGCIVRCEGDQNEV